MFCIKCGVQLPEDANFCLKCGYQFKSDIPSEHVTWEYTMLYGTMNTSCSDLWNEKYRDKDGKTVYTSLKELGLNGWELVSTTPISNSTVYHLNGVTREILFVFKRVKR